MGTPFFPREIYIFPKKRPLGGTFKRLPEPPGVSLRGLLLRSPKKEVVVFPPKNKGHTRDRVSPPRRRKFVKKKTPGDPPWGGGPRNFPSTHVSRLIFFPRALGPPTQQRGPKRVPNPCPRVEKKRISLGAPGPETPRVKHGSPSQGPQKGSSPFPTLLRVWASFFWEMGGITQTQETSPAFSQRNPKGP